MNYIILEEINPSEAVKLYSSELFKISRPTSDQSDVTKYLFGWIEHPANGAISLQIDLDYQLVVHPDKDIATLAQMLASKITPVSDTEIDALRNYVDATGSVRIGDIIPSEIHIYSREEMEDDEWFPDAEI